MAQLQWLGTAPPRRKSRVGEAIKGGVESFLSQREKRLEREVDLAKISFDKKKKSADLILKAGENATPEQKKQIGESQAGDLLKDVYGQEAFDSWMSVGGKGKANKLAKVGVWINKKSKQSPMTGLDIPMTSRSRMDTAIALELNDVDWQNTYPDLAAKFNTAYATKSKQEKKGGWPWGKKTDYKNMSEQDLFNKAKEGDQEAVKEAISRGYAVGGR